MQETGHFAEDRYIHVPTTARLKIPRRFKGMSKLTSQYLQILHLVSSPCPNVCLKGQSCYETPVFLPSSSVFLHEVVLWEDDHPPFRFLVVEVDGNTLILFFFPWKCKSKTIRKSSNRDLHNQRYCKYKR